jgi:hypothetical protein
MWTDPGVKVFPLEDAWKRESDRAGLEALGGKLETAGSGEGGRGSAVTLEGGGEMISIVITMAERQQDEGTKAMRRERSEAGIKMK